MSDSLPGLRHSIRQAYFRATPPGQKFPELESAIAAHPHWTATERLELVLVDQFQRWRLGEVVTAEEYLARFPDLARESSRALTLILEEFGYREMAGESPQLADFVRRFPHWSEALRRELAPGDAVARDSELRTAVVSVHAAAEDSPRSVPAAVPAAARLSFDEMTLGTLIGPYRLERLLGLGAFGEVWLAQRRGALAATHVALKLPHYHPRLLADVKSEAQTWVRASGHPNVVPILDADIYDGRVIIASEYIADGSLQDLLMRQQGSLLPLPESTDLVTGILIGLEHLHGRGIVHRDLKPANVLLQSGFPRLTDFGLSRLTTVDSSQQVGGTPAYMAPEAFNGERTTVTDLWSVGVILYQLLTGQLPFPQSRYLDLIRAISDPDPVNIPDFVPASLREVLRRSLAKQPEQRFQSAAEMRSHLSASRHEWEAVTGVPGTAGDGYRTIAVTGSMHCDSRQLRQNLAELLRPYYGRRTNWYVGTWGAVDEAAAEQLALDRQNLLLVGHRHDDISPHMRALIAQYELPFVDAAGLEIHHGSPSVPDEVPELRAVDSEAAAMNRRDHYFLARADLVVLVWDGFSRGTGAFLACLTQARKKHLLAFV